MASKDTTIDARARWGCDQMDRELEDHMNTDPQIQALVQASGHTVHDAIIILTELNKMGWTVQPIRGFVALLTEDERRAVNAESIEHWGGHD